jgi:hypothetical protein
MSPKDPEESQLIGNAARFSFVEDLVEFHLLQPSDAYWRLVQPLISKKTFNRKVSVRGNLTEVQITVELIGSNGVRYLTDAILRAIKTDTSDGKILTTLTQIFVSRRDTVPASTDLRTIILDYINGTPELNRRWDKLFITVVDESGVHRAPVARFKTFL